MLAIHVLSALFTAATTIAALCLAAHRIAPLPGGAALRPANSDRQPPVPCLAPPATPAPVASPCDSTDDSPTERWSRVTGTLDVTRLNGRIAVSEAAS